MFSMILSAAVLGVEARPVQVEADVCDGLPMFCMVGDLSPEVREAADRVRTEKYRDSDPTKKNYGESFAGGYQKTGDQI